MLFKQQFSFNEREKRIQKFDLKEIELVFSRTCNLSCSFCPHNNKDYKLKKGFMNNIVLKTLLQQLKNKSIFYEVAGFGEPFMHPEFKKLIKILDRINDKSYFTIITNGILFKKNFKDYYNFFKKLKHLKEIKISCYSNEIYNFFKKKNISWITLKNNFNFNLFNNRAGSIPNINSDKKYNSCNYPFFFLTVDYDGDILPCPHEWEKRLVIGNILNEDIKKNWLSEKINYLRKKFIENKRQDIYPCNICTAPGTLIGDKAKEDFKRVLNE